MTCLLHKVCITILHSKVFENLSWYFSFLNADATVHASIIPKQNEEVVKPRGIKVKPKTILGSRRHVSGLDKSKRRRTKNKVQSVPEAHHIDTLTV